jgi:hypothetical protein
VSRTSVLRGALECTKPQARELDCGFGVLVAGGGVEPPTYRFSVGRSYQLSYPAKTGKPYRNPSAPTKTGRRSDLGGPNRCPYAVQVVWPPSRVIGQQAPIV